MQLQGNGTCVLVGDDAGFLAEAAALAEQELGCKVWQGRSQYMLPMHSQQKFNHLPLEDRCAATLHLFSDMELLAHTDYFVGAHVCIIFHVTSPRRACCPCTARCSCACHWTIAALPRCNPSPTWSCSRTATTLLVSHWRPWCWESAVFF